MLGNERASQFSTNKSIVPECRWALCPIAAKRLIFRNVCLKRFNKASKEKKGFDRPARLLLLQRMFDVFPVLDVLLVLLHEVLKNSHGY